MLPKVSILIPTYNRPHFFHQALKSALAQTYQNIEIIVGDNSDNDHTERIVETYIKDNCNISYFRNKTNIGPIKNQQKCFNLSTGEFINYLMDDDLFHYQKIEKMMQYFLNYKDIALVTSFRKLIEKNGFLLKNNNIPTLNFEKDTIMDGIQLGNLILRNSLNYIGEPTTVLFRKKDLDEPFGVFAGKQSENNVDVGSWLNLLAKGKAVYIVEPLSYFRIHDQQLTHSESWQARQKGTQDWANHISDARKKGFLQD